MAAAAVTVFRALGLMHPVIGEAKQRRCPDRSKNDHENAVTHDHAIIFSNWALSSKAFVAFPRHRHTPGLPGPPEPGSSPQLPKSQKHLGALNCQK